nr:EpsG family protein [uncultured Methylophaga sp.]
MRPIHSFFIANKSALFIPAVIFMQILLSLFIGYRDLSIGSDTYRYAEYYQALKDCLTLCGEHEVGFQIFGYIFAYTGQTTASYFFGISLFIFLMLNLVSLKFVTMFNITYEQNRDYFLLLLLIFFIFLLSPFFVSAHINAIRQGIASFVVYLSLFFFITKNWKLFLLTALIASSFHHTALMYLAFSPLLLLTLNRLILIVVLLTISYLSGLSEFLLHHLSDMTGLGIYEKVVNYQLKVSYQRGVRWDFTLFSIFLALIPYFICRYLVIDKFKDGMITALKVYLVLLIPFFLFGYAAFSNRFLYTAWLYLPFLAAGTLISARYFNNWKNWALYILMPLSPAVFVIMIMNGFAR